MRSLLQRALLVSLALAIAACASEPPPPSPSTYFFARRVDESRGDFDAARFRSFRKDGRLATALTMDDLDARYALVPPLPSRLTYRLRVPENARLEFAVGASALGDDALRAPIEFAVEIDDGDGPRRVFEETLLRRHPNRWFDRRVDLGEWAGLDVAITFDTRLRATPYLPSPESIAASGPAALAGWGHPVLGSDESSERPDLILVSIDCLRADHVGAYGYDRPTTPSIDAFAEDAVVFERARSVSSWTLPTHMSMLTGLMPAEHGLRRDRKREPSIPYLPEILSRQGYETIGIVSGLYLAPAFGYEQGFDVYRVLADRPAGELVDAALERFAAEPRRPRFLFLHFFDAHWPYDPPDEFLERMGGRPPEISDLLRNVLNRKPVNGARELEHVRRLYDGEVASVDARLGAFFSALRERDRYDDAVIVLTADHGEGFYEHGLWQHSEIIHDEVLHVPLIVKGPAGSPTGRASGLVSQIHVFPTLLRAAGLDSPYSAPDLMALARGEAPFPERVVSEIVWEGNEETGPRVQIAVVEGSRKYIATFAGEPGGERFVSTLEREELYDLAGDPGERNNLLPSSGGDIGSLRSEARRFVEVVNAGRASSRGETIVIDPEMKRKLEALGYVQP